MPLRLLDAWPHLIAAGFTLCLAVGAAGHAIIYKRDVRAALGWVGLILMVPLVGSLFYVLFGINRIRRKAVSLRRATRFTRKTEPDVFATVDSLYPDFSGYTRLADQVTRQQLVSGNQVEVLEDMGALFEDMGRTMDGAQTSIVLSTYIFDRGVVAERLVAALTRARQRGVSVRVLIDSVGVRYSFPSIMRALKKAKIPVALFGRHFLPWHWHYFNLRNHRKLLVVDDEVGFSGGANIRDSYLWQGDRDGATRDLHFKLRGPVVHHLSQCFEEDWAHVSKSAPQTNEVTAWREGGTLARGISDGPDEDFEQLKWILLGAIAAAKTRIRIASPYFLPDAALISQLNLAALRGVDVEVLLPGRNNLLLVKWASRHQLWQILKQGCKVFFGPPPFDHSKLMLVDESWCLFGSANWDARSLRLNFEFNVECLDRDLCQKLHEWFDHRLAQADKCTLEQLDARPLPIRLRDGTARLLLPYL
ncbi:MAG: PLDc N-terminal domain-containing protein [Acidobacteria bacterium]|nr:PLDc N-terminal domain-containing protein [Acidobacteriota bacterium]